MVRTKHSSNRDEPATDKRQHKDLNTQGRRDNEGHVKSIWVGQIITKEGNTQGQEVKYLRRETKVSIKIKQEILKVTCIDHHILYDALKFTS